MKLRDDLNALTPRLRRYARALTSGHPGGSELADDLVHAALMRALGSRNLGTHSDLVVRLYATLTLLHRDLAPSSQRGQAAAGGGQGRLVSMVHQSKLTAGLMSLPVEDREALLLVALECFDHGEAARILHISRAALFARLTRARVALDACLQPRSGGSTAPIDERDRHVTHLRLVK